MAKKVILSVGCAALFTCWLLSLCFVNLLSIYQIDNNLKLFLSIFGAIVLLLLSLKYQFFIIFLVLYLFDFFIAIWINKGSPDMLILWFPFITLAATLIFKYLQIALLSICFSFIFILSIILGSYNFIQLKAGNKCVFVKNDGHFVENSLKQ